MSVVGGLLILVPTIGLLAGSPNLGLEFAFGGGTDEEELDGWLQEDAEPGEDTEGDPDEALPDDEAEDSDGDDGEAEGAEEPGVPDVEVYLDEAGRPDVDVPGDDEVVRPEVEGLDDPQRVIGDLLLDIEASERVMLGFQIEAQEAFAEGEDPDEPDAVSDAVRTAAARGLEGLAILAERLDDEQEVGWAEQVRATYVVHLGSWVRYLEAVLEDPDLLLGETGRYTVDINRTGGDFTRAVAAERPDGLARELEQLAEDIVERGFPETEDPQV